MTELFDIPDSPSPKLKWMRAHGVITFRFPDGEWLAGLSRTRSGKLTVDEWFLAETSEWNDTRIGVGDSEDEAIISLCQKHGLTHYSLS